MRVFDVHTIENLDMNPVIYGAAECPDIAARVQSVDAQMSLWGNTPQTNMMENLRMVSGGNGHGFKKELVLSDVFNLHTGKKFLIVGAGPSAAQRVEQILEAKRLGYILIAVDSVVPFLHQHGIEPEYAMGFDMQDICDRFHRPFPNTHWFLRITCSPKFTSLIPMNRRIWYSSANPFSTFWLNAWKSDRADSSKLHTGLREHMNVMFSAVDAAYKMGATHIITAGNDLAYLINSTCEHCGCPDIKEVLKDRAVNESITLLSNNLWVTKDSFQNSAQAFGNYVRWYPDCAFYDMSLGLVKPGWKGITQLKEVL